jgi:hypothetical protein
VRPLCGCRYAWQRYGEDNALVAWQAYRMPLSPPVLSGLIQTNMLANPAIGAVSGAALSGMCDAIATAVITHLTTAGVVTSTGVAPPGGGPVPSVGVIT